MITDSNGGFTAVLTERANGVSASTMNFNPATVNAAGSGGVDVTCEDIASVGAVNTTNIAVTYAGTSRTASIVMIIACSYTASHALM